MERNYRVIVRNSQNKIEVCYLFTVEEEALICFREFLKRYSHYHKIVIEAVHKSN